MFGLVFSSLWLLHHAESYLSVCPSPSPQS